MSEPSTTWKADDGLRFTIQTGTFEKTPIGRVQLDVSPGIVVTARTEHGNFILDPERMLAQLMQQIEEANNAKERT